MIVITGASDGLGLQLAKLYKEAGDKVVNVSRTKSEFADFDVLCDLKNVSEIKLAAKKISEMDENLDAIVNCAGVMSIQKLGEIDDDVLDSVLSVNIKSQILLISELIEKIKRDKSDIVNVASTVGTKGYADQAVYGASKWAVRGFSANLQTEFKDLPNRVISFCPGGFESKIFEKATGEKLQDFSQWMKPENLAKFMKQILDLPKNMEVSEVIINRKATV